MLGFRRPSSSSSRRRLLVAVVAVACLCCLFALTVSVSPTDAAPAPAADKEDAGTSTKKKREIPKKADEAAREREQAEKDKTTSYYQLLDVAKTATDIEVPQLQHVVLSFIIHSFFIVFRWLLVVVVCRSRKDTESWRCCTILTKRHQARRPPSRRSSCDSQTVPQSMLVARSLL